MVIRQFHIVGVAMGPPEADPVLVVHSDTELAGPLPFQGFQAVSGRNAQILQVSCAMQQAEPPQCTPGNWGPLTRGFVPFVRCD
jgi:hypothetical protein